MPLRLLGVFAHPLDGSLLCGGTFARYAAAGVETAIACATAGQPSTALTAARAMGVRHLLLLGYEPGELAGLPASTLPDVVRDVLRSFRPDVVVSLALDGLGAHPDHQAVQRAASAAFEEVRRTPGASGRPPRRLYEASLPRREAQRLIPAMGQAGIAVPCLGVGAPGAIESTVTAVLDVRSHRDAKLAAIRASGSAPGPPLSEAPAGSALDHEFFRRAFPAPWVSGVLERELLAGLSQRPGEPFSSPMDARLAG